MQSQEWIGNIITTIDFHWIIFKLYIYLLSMEKSIVFGNTALLLSGVSVIALPEQEHKRSSEANLPSRSTDLRQWKYHRRTKRKPVVKQSVILNLLIQVFNFFILLSNILHLILTKDFVPNKTSLLVVLFMYFCRLQIFFLGSSRLEF